MKLGIDSNIPWWLNLGLIEEENRKIDSDFEEFSVRCKEGGRRTHDCETKVIDRGFCLDSSVSLVVRFSKGFQGLCVFCRIDQLGL